MREILFKAKRKNWKELPKEQWWVVGVPMKIENKNMMLLEDNDNLLRVHYTDDEMWCSEVYSVEIDIDTLCPYTGLTDKNGNKIWENDIVCTPYVDPIFGDMVNTTIRNYFRWKVVFYDGLYVVENETKRIYLRSFTNGNNIEVIGNIFDNKELLEK